MEELVKNQRQCDDIRLVGSGVASHKVHHTKVLVVLRARADHEQKLQVLIENTIHSFPQITKLIAMVIVHWDHSQQ